MNCMLKWLGFNFPPEEKELSRQIQPTFLQSEKEKYPYSDQIREKFFADLKKFPIEEWEIKHSQFGISCCHPLLKYELRSVYMSSKEGYIKNLYDTLSLSFQTEIGHIYEK